MIRSGWGQLKRAAHRLLRAATAYLAPFISGKDKHVE